MSSDLQTLLESTTTAIRQADTLEALDLIRVQALGKQGHLTQLLKQVGKMDPTIRPAMGKAVNLAKRQLQATLEKQRQVLEEVLFHQKMQAEAVDVSLPGRGHQLGTCHPLSSTQAYLEEFFIQAGFTLENGPEVEDEAHNFTALNIPSNHPARASHDTFYLSNGLLLRTHTSTVQIRSLQKNSPPLRIIATGRVYRRDSDITHTPMFHQLEGLVIDETANFSELKGLLTHFLQCFFKNPNLVTRFRASYFPFTEPSAEVDVQCVLCQGQGCKVCSHTGWLEILGCGMVHPKVLIGAKVDPERYQGYAFGMGIDRLTLLRYRIPDLRLLFENDMRFLNQF